MAIKSVSAYACWFRSSMSGTNVQPVYERKLLKTMKSLLTVIGNLIIIKSFVSNPKLRTMNNLYIINLAIADIIIGLVSMNFFTVYLVSNSWIFGPTICDAWLTIDYVASNTSVLTLVIICFDRYCSGQASPDQGTCWTNIDFRMISVPFMEPCLRSPFVPMRHCWKLEK